MFCAELDVPLDYEALEGDTLPIAMNRLLANPDEPHRGVLLFNPGGPGASGKEVAASLHDAGVFDAIAPGFDVIGFDPRGVAESGSRSCGPVSEDSLRNASAQPAAAGNGGLRGNCRERIGIVVVNFGRAAPLSARPEVSSVGYTRKRDAAHGRSLERWFAAGSLTTPRRAGPAPVLDAHQTRARERMTASGLKQRF